MKYAAIVCGSLVIVCWIISAWTRNPIDTHWIETGIILAIPTYALACFAKWD